MLGRCRQEIEGRWQGSVAAAETAAAALSSARGQRESNNPCAPPPSRDRRWPSRSRTSSRLRGAGWLGGLHHTLLAACLSGRTCAASRGRGRLIGVRRRAALSGGSTSSQGLHDHHGARAGRAASHARRGLHAQRGPRHPGHANDYGSQHRHHRCDGQLGVPVGRSIPPSTTRAELRLHLIIRQPATHSPHGTPACAGRRRERSSSWWPTRSMRACPADEAPLRRQPVTVIAVQVLSPVALTTVRAGRPACAV